jgi:hypothetical protein
MPRRSWSIWPTPLSTVPSDPERTASLAERRPSAAPRESRLRRAYRWLTCDDPVLAAALWLLVAYYVCQRGVFQGKASGDGWFGFQFLPAIVYHQTLDMQRVIPEYLPYFATGGPLHRMPNRCPFGPVLVWMPFYLVGCLVERAAALLHLLPRSQGDSPVAAWFAALGSLSGALVGMRYVYAMVARRFSGSFGRTPARLAAITCGWATPLAWYAVVQPMYQHALAFCAVAILVERWDATLGRTDLARFVLLGGIGGLAMEMRAQEVLYLALPAGEIAYHLATGPHRLRWLRGGLVLSGAALIAFVPQVMVWHYYTGTLSPPQVEPLRLTTPFLVMVLFSTRGGLFPWSPITYLAVAGLAVTVRGTRRLVWGLTAVFAIEVYVIACAWLPAGGYGYGARRLSDGVMVLGLGVALAYARVKDSPLWRRALCGFLGFCVLTNVFAMEMQRWRKTASSGGSARTAAHYLGEIHAPYALQHFFEKVGYPFVQPAGWIFGLYHHTSASAFEGVVGNFFLDRDGQWFTLQQKSLPLSQATRSNVAGGLALTPTDKRPSPVTGKVRFLLSMFAREPVDVIAVGPIGTLGPSGAWGSSGELKARWNGAEVAITREREGVRVRVPEPLVNPGV